MGNGIQWIHGYMPTDQQTALSLGSEADPHKRRVRIYQPRQKCKRRRGNAGKGCFTCRFACRAGLRPISDQALFSRE